MSLVFAIALAQANTVEIDGARWRELRDPTVEKEAAPPPQVLFREVRIDPRVDELRFDATWSLRSAEGAWFEARITGPDVQITQARYGGKELAITEGPDGVSIAVWLDGTGTLAVRGVKVGVATRDSVVLDLLPAAVGRVVVQSASKPVVTARGPVIALGDGIWTGAPGLALKLVDRAPPSPRPDLAVATSALGLTVGEGSVDGRGRVRWEVRHGLLSSVSFDASGVGADLEVKGPAMASWSRSGDRVSVVLREPEDRLVELELSWSGTVPAGEEASLALPAIRPLGAFKTDSSVQLARDGEIEVVPRLSGWTAVPFSDLPEWGRGLVAGTATASFTTSASPGGSVGLFRFTPVSGPPTFVDVATITAASSDDGTVLMRAHYAVRNDRSPHLRVTPPDGASIVGARVAGETAQVARDGTSWLIPLGKSVETVEGLLAFPVEVVLLMRGEPWALREDRTLQLPRVNAPVAVTRATLHLPPGYASELEGGDGDVVGAFTDGEGIAYGQGTGASAHAESLMQEAVQAWMSNDFSNAEGLLRELEEVGGFDENAKRLQSNLDVISGKGSGQYDVAMERRVKEQAKARSLEDQAEQSARLKQAESSYLSGDYASAEVEYKKALDLGEKLGKLEQDESVEVDVRNSALVSKLEETREEVEREVKKKAKEDASKAAMASNEEKSRQESEAYRKGEAAAAAVADERAAAETAQRVVISKSQIAILEPFTGSSGDDGGRVVFDFSDQDIEGELVTVDGEFFSGVPGGVAGGEVGGVDTSSTADGQVLSKDFLSRIPTGRSFQSSVGLSSGVTGEGGNENMGGGSFRDDRDADGVPDAQDDDGRYGMLGGVEGGVVGGVVGGQLGGVAGGSHSITVGDDVAGPDTPEPTEDELVDMPTNQPVQVMESRRPGIKLPNIQVGGRRDAQPQPDFKPEMDSGPAIQFGRDKPIDAPPPPPVVAEKPAKPAVTAVQMTAVIPTQGEAVRYERLLLESDAAYALTIDAKTRRRDR